MLYRMRPVYPWYYLPCELGDRSQAYQKFNNCSEKGVLMSVFDDLKTGNCAIGWTLYKYRQPVKTYLHA